MSVNIEGFWKIDVIDPLTGKIVQSSGNMKNIVCHYGIECLLYLYGKCEGGLNPIVQRSPTSPFPLVTTQSVVGAEKVGLATGTGLIAYADNTTFTGEVTGGTYARRAFDSVTLTVNGTYNGYSTLVYKSKFPTTTIATTADITKVALFDFVGQIQCGSTSNSSPQGFVGPVTVLSTQEVEVTYTIQINQAQPY